MDGGEHFGDAGVGFGVVVTVIGVISALFFEDGIDEVLVLLVEAAGDQFAGAVADFIAEGIDGVRGQAEEFEGVIGAVGEVAEGVDEGAVEVEND